MSIPSGKLLGNRIGQIFKSPFVGGLDLAAEASNFFIDRFQNRRPFFGLNAAGEDKSHFVGTKVARNKRFGDCFGFFGGSSCFWHLVYFIMSKNNEQKTMSNELHCFLFSVHCSFIWYPLSTYSCSP